MFQLETLTVAWNAIVEVTSRLSFLTSQLLIFLSSPEQFNAKQLLQVRDWKNLFSYKKDLKEK